MDTPAQRNATNRSIPDASVIPELAYPDVGQAVDWLCDVFGFTLRLRIGNHRAQLLFGDGAVIVREEQGSQASVPHQDTHSLLVRVEDVDRHYEHARDRGARILDTPTTYFYGERQYNVEDPAGHRWKFSQSIDDTDPQSWGASTAD